MAYCLCGCLYIATMGGACKKIALVYSQTMSKRLAIFLVLLLIIPLAALALLRGRKAAAGGQQTATAERAPALPEPIADLQRRIDSGEIRLEHHADRGYADSVLKHLNVPPSSQTLVFGKNSAQLFFIAPDAPRALYFNDEVYVGYVQYGSYLEVASMDPKLGPVFYALEQVKQDRPQFRNDQANCIACHDTFTSDNPVPRLLMLSILPDPTGVALNRAALVTNDASPMRERWGGWYVTGTHGKQQHLGNTFVRTPASAIGEMKQYIQRIDLSAGANVTDLKGRFDANLYQTPYSDIVALMVLGHQTHVHNLIVDAAYNVTGNSTAADVQQHGEPIVKSMLFSGAVPLTEPVAGPSGFAAEFSQRGPRDSKGRSLRDFDLQTRLFRYPMSYLIYSKSFDALSAPLKAYVDRRFREVLSGEDKSAEFAHLSAADRQAIREILQETKPGFE